MGTAEQTSTQVANLALAHCGVSKPIANLDTERSVEAQMCRTFFDLARQDTFRDFPWRFAVKQIAPSIVSNQPTPEWLYAYLYPSDALKITRFMSWRLNNDTRQSRIPYTIMQATPASLSILTPSGSGVAASALWIFTNWPGTNSSLPTLLEYIFDNQNVAQWTPDFVMAYSYKLATLIVPTLTTGDPYQTQQKIMQLYDGTIAKASANSGNEEQRPQEPQSEFIRAREGDGYGFPGSNWVAEPAGFVVQ